MTNKELLFICDAIKEITLKHREREKDYKYNLISNEYENIIKEVNIEKEIKEFFVLN